MAREWGVALAGSSLALVLSGCGMAGAPAEDVPNEGTQSQAAEESGGNFLDKIRDVVDQTESVESYRARVTTSDEDEGVDVGDTEIVYVSEPEPTFEMITVVDGKTSTRMMRGSEIVVGSAESGWMSLDTGEELGIGDMVNPMNDVKRTLSSPDVEEVGSEEVNGVKTTKYAGTYSLDEVLAEMDAETRALSEQGLAESGVSEVRFTMWVDGDGLPRRVESEVGDLITQVDFLEFNTDVSIDYPDAADIVDLSDLGSLGDLGDIDW